MTTAAENLDRYFSGTVDEKLATAHQLLAQYGKKLLQHKDIKDYLAGLRHHETILDAQMGAMEMGKRCSACASTPKGGCCSNYMAGNTDAILLLINLLINIDVTIQHDNGIDCCFLGRQGCILPIKPIFCLNYNCTHIQNSATTDEMQLLHRHAGTLLSLQTKTEGLLLDLINQQ